MNDKEKIKRKKLGERTKKVPLDEFTEKIFETCTHCNKPFKITASPKGPGSYQKHVAIIKANATIYKRSDDPKYRAKHPNAPMVKKWIRDHHLI